MATDRTGLGITAWPQTWASSGNHPIILENDVRGGWQFVAGTSGDQLTDIPGAKLQEGMIVYVKDAYTSGTVEYTGSTYYTFAPADGESRGDSVVSGFTNNDSNWSKFSSATVSVENLSDLGNVSIENIISGQVLKATVATDGTVTWSPMADNNDDTTYTLGAAAGVTSTASITLTPDTAGGAATSVSLTGDDTIKVSQVNATTVQIEVDQLSIGDLSDVQDGALTADNDQDILTVNSDGAGGYHWIKEDRGAMLDNAINDSAGNITATRVDAATGNDDSSGKQIKLDLQDNAVTNAKIANYTIGNDKLGRTEPLESFPDGEAITIDGTGFSTVVVEHTQTDEDYNATYNLSIHGGAETVALNELPRFLTGTSGISSGLARPAVGDVQWWEFSNSPILVIRISSFDVDGNSLADRAALLRDVEEGGDLNIVFNMHQVGGVGAYAQFTTVTGATPSLRGVGSDAGDNPLYGFVVTHTGGTSFDSQNTMNMNGQWSIREVKVAREQPINAGDIIAGPADRVLLTDDNDHVTWARVDTAHLADDAVNVDKVDFINTDTDDLRNTVVTINNDGDFEAVASTSLTTGQSNNLNFDEDTNAKLLTNYTNGGAGSSRNPIRNITYLDINGDPVTITNFTINVAEFQPETLGATPAPATTLNWDVPVTGFNVNVQNDPLFTDRYINRVSSVTSVRGTVPALSAFTAGAQSTTPAAGVDWTQSFTGNVFTDAADSSTAGGFAEGRIAFADESGNTFSGTTVAGATATPPVKWNWLTPVPFMNVNNPAAVTFLQSVSGATFSGGISNLSNDSTAAVDLFAFRDPTTLGPLGDLPTPTTTRNFSGTYTFAEPDYTYADSGLVTGTVAAASVTVFTVAGDVTSTFTEGVVVSRDTAGSELLTVVSSAHDITDDVTTVTFSSNVGAAWEVGDPIFIRSTTVFTTTPRPIHKDNTSLIGGVNLEYDLTRPANIISANPGTTFTTTRVSDVPVLTFRYPSFTYIVNNEPTVTPTNSDIVDGNSFRSAVTIAGGGTVQGPENTPVPAVSPTSSEAHQAVSFAADSLNTASDSQTMWFAVRESVVGTIPSDIGDAYDAGAHSSADFSRKWSTGGIGFPVPNSVPAAVERVALQPTGADAISGYAPVNYIFFGFRINRATDGVTYVRVTMT